MTRVRKHHRKASSEITWRAGCEDEGNLSKGNDLKDNSVYALFSEWPNGGSSPTLTLTQVKATQGSSNFTLLDGGRGINLQFTTDGGVVNIALPMAPPMGTFIAWVIKMDGIQPV
ncbi:hypothetical protein ACTXT7_015587 [Hymenolepis weldensis]